VAGLPLGYLADRVSRRNLIAAGLLIWSLATMAGSLAQGFGEIFASRVFVGLGEAALSPAAIALISDYFPPSRRGLAVGCFLSGIAMGSGVAIMLGGAVLQAVDAGLFTATPLAHLAAWRMVLVLVGLPGLAWCLLIFVIREPKRRAAGDLATSAKAPGAAEVGAGRFSWLTAGAVYLVVAMASRVWQVGRPDRRSAGSAADRRVRRRRAAGRISGRQGGHAAPAAGGQPGRGRADPAGVAADARP
jgi:MFS family permease